MSKNDSQITATDDLGENGVVRLPAPAPAPLSSSSSLKKMITQRFNPVINPEMEAKLEHIVKTRKIDAVIEAELVNNPHSYLTDPDIIALFKQYDTNGDGELDDEEMARVIHKLISKKRQATYLKYTIGGLLLLVIIHLISNTLLTLWMLRVTKVIDINNGNNYLTSTNGNLVSTDSPRYYTLLTDIPSLPPKALNSLTRISFTTVDSSLHNYDVMGTHFAIGSVNTVSLFFSSGKELRITPTSAVLRTNDFQGSITEVGVITNPDSTNAQQRRRQMVIDNDALAPDRDLLGDEFVDRCSNAEGICYHTYDEIIELHEILHTELSSDGRMLATASGGAVTYAEVSADVVAFSKANSRSAVSLAQDFLENIVKAGPPIAANTTTISFVMKDRCANYDSLIADCQKHPAPEVAPYAGETASILDNGFYADVPFFGMSPVDGKWFFRDEISYRKDKDTIQLKVRYAHDPYRASRIHVVMVDRNNPSRVLSYDEVTTTTNPAKPTETLSEPQTFITNYEYLDRISEPGSAFEPEISRQDFTDMSRHRKLVADDAFHAHILTKISGFPKISILEDFIGHPDVVSATFTSNSNDADGRKLDETIAPVMIDIDTTTQGSYVIAKAADLGLNMSETLLAGEYVAGFNVTSVDNDGRRLSSSTDEIVGEPKAIFDSVSVTNENGYIVWPSQSDAVSLPDYEASEILYRSELKDYKDFHSSYDNTTFDSSAGSRKLLEGFKDTWYHFYEDEDHVQNSWRRLQLSQDGLVDVRKPMPHFLQKSIEKTRKRKADFKELDTLLGELIGNLVAERNEARRLQETNQRELKAKKKGVKFPGTKREDEEIAITGDALNQMIEAWEDREILIMTEENKDYWGPYYNKKLAEETDKFQRSFGSKLLRLSEVKSVAYKTNATSASCQSFYSEWGRTLKNLEKLVTVQEQITDVAEKTKDGIDYAPKVERLLTTILDLDKLLARVVPAVGSIPYVGGIIKVMYNVLHRTVQTLLTPARNGVQRLIDVESRIKLKSKIEKFLEKNEKLTDAISFVSYQYFFALGLTLVDQTCPGLSNVNVTCSGASTALQKVNNEYENNIIQPMRTVKNQLSAIWDVLNPLKSFFNSLDVAALDALQSVMARVNSFLSYRIEIRIPYPNFRLRTSCTWVAYPCGVHWCRRCPCWGRCCFRYPCGVQWCWYHACISWWEPFLDWKSFNFSVSDIINGMTRVASFVMDALMSALERVVRAMGFNIPTIPIPGIPGLDELMRAIANFESLVVPNLDFLIESLTEAISKLKFTIPRCGN